MLGFSPRSQPLTQLLAVMSPVLSNSSNRDNVRRQYLHLFCMHIAFSWPKTLSTTQKGKTELTLQSQRRNGLIALMIQAFMTKYGAHVKYIVMPQYDSWIPKKTTANCSRMGVEAISCLRFQASKTIHQWLLVLALVIKFAVARCCDTNGVEPSSSKNK